MAEVTGETGGDVGDDAGDGGEVASPAPRAQARPQAPQARRIKLMLEGREQELDESELATNFLKGRNSARLLTNVEQKRQEALRAQHEAHGFMARLKDDPFGLLQELGIDITERSEQAILERIRFEKMSPAERKAYEYEKKIKELENERARRDEEHKQAERIKEVESHKDQLANLFLETMERTGLPRSAGRFVMPRIAALYAQNERMGLESSLDEMVEHVMRGLRAEHTGFLGGLDGDALLDRLGPEVVAKIINANRDRLKARKTPAVVAAQPQKNTRPGPKPQPKVRGDAFFRRLSEGNVD